MYKTASKDLKESNKTASPDKNNKHSHSSPVKKTKDPLTQNGTDDINKPVKKKKKDKDKDKGKEKEKDKDKPKSERFMKIDQGNSKPPMRSMTGSSPMKRKRDENDIGSNSLVQGDGKSMSYKRLNMDGSQGR